MTDNDIYETNINNLININKNIEGDYIELGTFKGKGTIIMGNFIKNNMLSKKLYTFDSFSGYTNNDIKNAKTKSEQVGLIINNNSSRWNIDKKLIIDKIKDNNIDDIVEIIEGDISQTINTINNKNLSLIFIDCNAYYPAFNALKHLNEQINHCCFLIVDEHTIGGETYALREFIDKYNIKGSMFKLDTNYLTGPRIIFNVDKSTNNEMKLQWDEINKILKNKYREVIKLGSSTENDLCL